MAWPFPHLNLHFQLKTKWSFMNSYYISKIKKCVLPIKVIFSYITPYIGGAANAFCWYLRTGLRYRDAVDDNLLSVWFWAVRNRQTLFVRIVFFYWKTTWDCLARGVFSIGYRGFRHLDTLLVTEGWWELENHYALALWFSNETNLNGLSRGVFSITDR